MTATNHKIFGLILAGGFSRRMGQNKALLEFHGLPQIEYLAKLLLGQCREVYLSKRKDQTVYKNISSIDDAPEFEGHGPLGGILSAMKAHPDTAWLVIACDLPLISTQTLKTLVDNRDPQKTATAFISTHDSLPEPLCALWEARAYEAVLKLFYDGLHCPRKVLIKSNTHLIKQEDPHWLDNINTLQEYENFKQAFKQPF